MRFLFKNVVEKLKNSLFFLVYMIYEPQEDSFLVQKHIKNYAHGDVLDMGTGSGILAEEAVKYTNKVLAVDVDLEAVEHGRENYNDIEFRESNLFSNIDESFDLIIFNPPYLPTESKDLNFALDGGKEGWEVIAEFLKQAKKYLKKNGVILLLFSSFSNKGKINKILKEEGYYYKEIDKQHIHFEDLYVYEITR